MVRLSRFACASSSLMLKDLLGKTQRGLWICCTLGIAIHLSLMQIGGLEAERQAAKPLTTQFIKRQPRLTKPLELKKRPKPKRRHIQRQMVSVKARLSRGKASTMVQPIQTLGGLAKPRAEVSRALGFKEALMEPEAIAAIVEGTKEPANKVDMSLEMMDITALDTGRYHALVIQDPNDKRSIKGFFRLRYAYSSTMHRDPWRMVLGVIAVVEAMNLYTDVKTTFEGRITFDRQELLKTPWVFSDIGKIEMPVGEKANLGKYLTSGGFAFFDAPEPNKDLVTPYPASNILAARRVVQQALETQGLTRDKDWAFERLAHSHPLFHCFFDFAGPPPCVYDKIYSNAGQIDGAYVAGRWCAIVSQKAFVHFWNDPFNPKWRNERMIQFGVNTIVFALTQEGSITHRLMDSIK